MAKSIMDETMKKKIYLMRPFVGEEELEAVRKVLNRSSKLSVSKWKKR
jgi:RNA polymerase-interacting CarD/CdnL/TRCF family regulator